MAVMKCKMCGGDLNVTEGMSVTECEYCGTKQTLPKVDDQQRAVAFDRGNHFRRLGEFDKALTVYERIVQEDENDAEAHWCCALCRFGIEYVKDPASGEYLPTCHRASFDSFLEDVDYKAALTHADGVARRQYQQDGERIAAIQRGILSTVQKEEPFDVFICYKESDENGGRTVDSTLAQEIYYQLTEQGRRVFFARITLEDKAGQEYEPYIFAALHSAKVMVVVGTRPEYLNAVWVRNEWSRYLALMKHDRKRLLIPCYRDMDPYDLPEQLSVLQSYDMSKIGFIQDLIRGVAKVLDADKPKPTTVVKESVVVQGEGGSSLAALLKRGNMALEDGEWDRADEFFEQVLNMDAECGEAYLGKALAAQQYGTLQVLTAQWKKAVPKHKVLTAGQEDTARINAIAKKYAVPSYLDEDTIRQSILKEKFDFTYQSAVDGWRELMDGAEAYFTRDKLMSRAVRYATGELAGQIETGRKEIQTALETAQSKARQADEESVRRVKAAYAAHLDQAEETAVGLNREAQARRQADYDAACAAQEKAATEEAYTNTAGQFDALGSYQDSTARAEMCRVEAERCRREAEAEAERQRAIEEKQRKERAARDKKLGIITYAVTAAVVVIGIVITQVIIPGGKYRNAEVLLATGDYDGAVAAFAELGSYKDAEDRILGVHYAEAEALFANGNTGGAAIVFDSLGDYKDAKERSISLWDEVAVRDTIAAGNAHTVGLKSDGTVVAVGSKSHGQCDVSRWVDIVAVATGGSHTVGLKSDGTVVAVGYNKDGRCDVSGWNDIVAVAAGDFHTVGLKSDGTVVATGSEANGQCDVEGWTDIVAITAGDYHTVGLKSDGTVVAVGSGTNGQCYVSDWRNIVAVAADSAHTMGLKSDGIVLVVGKNEDGQCNVYDWRDIVAVTAGEDYMVGLISNGTVVAVGDNEYGRCDVDGWQDIVAVAAGDYHTVSLRQDGTVMATGYNVFGQCDVSGWSGIKVPKKG